LLTRLTKTDSVRRERKKSGALIKVACAARFALEGRAYERTTRPHEMELLQ